MKLVPRTFALFAVLALATLALSLATMRATGGGTPSEGSAEVRFVREMIQHHTQAVDMALRVRDRSEDPDLRAVALDMLLSQQDQIGQMRGWLTQWNVPWGGVAMTSKHATAMGMAAPDAVASLSTLPTKQAETRFLQLMIRHHLGALTMAWPMLESGRSEVRQFARAIVNAQQGEIEMMKTFLRARGAETPATSPAREPVDHSSH